jgi:hypothetical protein
MQQSESLKGLPQGKAALQDLIGLSDHKKDGTK